MRKVNGEFLEIFDGIDAPVYVADPETYEILYANKAFKRFFSKNLLAKNVIKFSKILISLARSVRTNTFLEKILEKLTFGIFRINTMAAGITALTEP